MGSLAYVAGGALAGLGQGLATVGKESLESIKQTKLEELRAQHEEQRQQELMAHQEQMQTSQQGFIHGENAIRTEAAVKAAGATREFEEGENQKNRASREKIADTNYARGVDSAYVRSAFGGKGAGGAGPGYKPITLQGNPFSTDPIERMTRVVEHDPSGGMYITIGDRTFRANPQGRPVDRDGNVIDAEAIKKLSRPPRGMADDLVRDPEGVIPNSSTKKFDYMINKYSFVPAGYLPALRAKRAPTGQASFGGSFSMPSGRVFKPSPGAPMGDGSGGGSDEDEQKDTHEETQEAPFHSGGSDVFNIVDRSGVSNTD